MCWPDGSFRYIDDFRLILMHSVWGMSSYSYAGDRAGAESVLQNKGRRARWGRLIIRLGAGMRSRRALRFLSRMAAGKQENSLSPKDVRNLILVAAEKGSPEFLDPLREACTEWLKAAGSGDDLRVSLCWMLLDQTSEDALRFIHAAWIVWWRPPTLHEMALLCGWTPGTTSAVLEKTKPSAFMSTVFPDP